MTTSIYTRSPAPCSSPLRGMRPPPRGHPRAPASGAGASYARGSIARAGSPAQSRRPAPASWCRHPLE